MTLDELRAKLDELGEQLPGATPIVQSIDAEGNGFGPLAEVTIGMYDEKGYGMDAYYMTEEERLSEPDPDEHFSAPERAVKSLFFWPV